MTRHRAAVVLLWALAWCAASPWLDLGRARAACDAVIAAAPHAEGAPRWLPRAAAAEPLARLSENDAGTNTLAADAARRGEPLAPSRRPRPAPAARRVIRSRSRWRPRARASDEPS